MDFTHDLMEGKTNELAQSYHFGLVKHFVIKHLYLTLIKLLLWKKVIINLSELSDDNALPV